MQQFADLKTQLHNLTNNKENKDNKLHNTKKKTIWNLYGPTWFPMKLCSKSNGFRANQRPSFR